MTFHVAADPHPWPAGGQVPISACALIVVDMQHDYCSPGFYMDQAGYDTTRLAAPIARIQPVLAAARRAGMHVIYTRHGRAVRPDEPLVLPASAGPRTAAPGEPGWAIVPELVPAPGETIVEKSTCSAFISGELDRLLRSKGIRHLAFCGNTIDVCVHSTLRTAVDLDYDCLLLADCCGAVNDELHRWSIASVQIENGVFGTVADAAAFVRALNA